MACEARISAEIVGRVLAIIGVVVFGELGLVREDINGSAKAGEFDGYRRDEVIADQDVLVLFLH